MKILHVLKSEPDQTTRRIMSVINQPDDVQATEYSLFQENPNYEELIDLIFENDKVISWW